MQDSSHPQKASGLPHYELVGTIPCPFADPRRQRRDASPPSPSDCRRSAVPLAGGTRGHGSLPVEGGLLDRELAFRLVESGRKGVLFYFFVVQRSMDEDLPGKIRKPIPSLYLTASEPEGREKMGCTGCGLVAGWPHDAGRLCSCAVPAGERVISVKRMLVDAGETPIAIMHKSRALLLLLPKPSPPRPSTDNHRTH